MPIGLPFSMMFDTTKIWESLEKVVSERVYEQPSEPCAEVDQFAW